MPWKFYHKRVVAPKKSLDKAASSVNERIANVIGTNKFLPVPYGLVRIGAKICAVTIKNNYLVILAAFCIGEITSIEKIFVDNIDINDPEKGLVAKYGGEVNTYLGSDNQPIDPIMQWAFGPDYTDTLDHVCYAVLKIPSKAKYSGIPRIDVILKGLKVFNPETSSYIYTTNPALILADYIVGRENFYGMGWEIDWDSVIEVKQYCDEEVAPGEKRRECSLLLDKPLKSSEWLEPLRTYAGCFISVNGKKAKLIPDRKLTQEEEQNVKHFDATNIKVLRNLNKRGLKDKPNVIEIVYTDISNDNWRDETVTVMTEGAANGSEPWRVSTIRLPGIYRYSQAKREAIERLNKLLNDLTIDFVVFDEGLELEPGDVFSVSHPIGLDNKLFRAVSISQTGSGLWHISGIEYDPSNYSDVVESAPVYNDTSLPDPSDVPEITGLTVGEIFGQKSDGTYFTKITASWNPVDWPYFKEFEVEIWQGANRVFVGRTIEPEITSPPIEELKLYTVKVRVISDLSAGEWTTADITPQGKYAPPGDVPSITGFEVGGEVRLRWEPPSDIDIWRYEVRYWAEGQSWDDGIILDRVDGLRLVTKDVPAGTWIFGVKAIDCVGNYSENPATITIDVTLDLEAFKALDATFDDSVLSGNNITVETVFYTDNQNSVVKIKKRAVAALGTASEVFTGDLTNYTAPVYSYRSAGSCSATLGPLPDPKLDPDATGTWRGQTDGWFTLSGNPTLTLVVLNDGNEVNSTNGPQYSINATGDQCKWEIVADGTDVFVLELPDFYTRCDAIPRKESGHDTSNASGPKTVQLENTYNAARRIVVTPKGNVPLSAVVDNVIPENGTFDVYIFDNNGNQVSAEFFWEWEGV